MSAAATAAGYLYASGRLRGREKREQQDEERGGETPPHAAQRARPRIEKPVQRQEVRVAAVPARDDTRPRRVPVVQYRTRRWKPEGQ